MSAHPFAAVDDYSLVYQVQRWREAGLDFNAPGEPRRWLVEVARRERDGLWRERGLADADSAQRARLADVWDMLQALEDK